MITRTEIDLRENSGSSQLIKKNINSGKRISKNWIQRPFGF
jgi:hypothetical protein